MVRLSWADQLGTPTWWGEIEGHSWCGRPLSRFARKIQASFHIPEIQYRASPSQGYSTPLAPKRLNWGAFISGRLEYQDVWQRLILLTEAYCRSLQHWMEKVYPSVNPDAHPLAESIKELCLAMSEFVTITKRDILEGLEMERPTDSHWLPSTTLFSQVLGPPTEGQETTLATIGIPQQNGTPRSQGRARPFLHVAPSWLPIGSPGASTVPTFPSTRALAVVWPSTPPQGFINTATHMKILEPAWLGRRTPTEVSAVERMTPRISSIGASRIVWDNSTGCVYLDTIAASIGRMVLGGSEPSEGPTIEDITDQS